jgi:hypothetical protein
MATLGANNLSISDIVRRTGPDGAFVPIAEMLSELNSLSTDCAWFEGELPAGHMSTVRDSLPTFATLQPNGVGSASKSTTTQTLESSEVIDSWIDAHDEVIKYGGNASAAIASEMPSYVESAMQTINDRIIYGNDTTTPGQLRGLAVRYNATSGTNGRSVILGGAAGGQTDCMSIYLIEHGQGKFAMWYPKGSKAGLDIEDFGRIPVTTSSGLAVRYQVHYKQSFGMGLDDWRSVARIANVDSSLLVAGTGADLPFRMNQATHCMMRGMSSGRKAFYMNRTGFLYLDDQCRNDVQAGGQLGYVTVAGQEMNAWRGIPINIFDTLTQAETAIS